MDDEKSEREIWEGRVEEGGKEEERQTEKQNDMVVKEVLALLHPKIFPALRIADVIMVRHRQPLIAKF